MCFIYFFFFQAEDGIRDSSVTGVQTCALPISRGIRRPWAFALPVLAAGWRSVREYRSEFLGGAQGQSGFSKEFHFRLSAPHFIISVAGLGCPHRVRRDQMACFLRRHQRGRNRADESDDACDPWSLPCGLPIRGL